MPLSRTSRWPAIAPLFAVGACTETDPSEEMLDCSALGGGYEGADTVALQAECEADPRGEDCDATAFIESDAAKCIAARDWSDQVDREHEAELGYTLLHRTVVWGVSRPASGWAGYVHATTGEFLGSVEVD